MSREGNNQVNFEDRTWRLLETIYGLADGNPGKMVSGQEAAERANIPHTTEDFDPVASHLRDSELIKAQDVSLEILNTTPAGVRAVN
jgi:hypothetical protein